MTLRTRGQWEAFTGEQMLRVGEELAALLLPGDVVLLIGEMGAGKTTLAKGIVAGFGAGSAEDVSSPTFTLVHEYAEGNFVFHLDLYRLESEQAVRAIGIDEMLDQMGAGQPGARKLSTATQALMLVEWGERFPNLWPGETVAVKIMNSEGRRYIEMQRPWQPPEP